MGQHQSEQRRRCRTDSPGVRVRCNLSKQSRVPAPIPARPRRCKTAHFARVPFLPFSLPPLVARACVSAYSSQPLQSADRSLLRVTRNSVCQNGPTDPAARRLKGPRYRERRSAHSESRQEGKGRVDAFVTSSSGTLTQTKRQRPTLPLSLSLPAIRSDPFSK